MLRLVSTLVFASVLCAPLVARANMKITEPPARSGADNLTGEFCGGVPKGPPRQLPVGTTQLQVKIADGVNDGSIGCFQLAFLRNADDLINSNNFPQMADDMAASGPRELSFGNIQIPGSCLGGATCSVHVRQLVGTPCAGGPTTSTLGKGSNTFYSCADFSVAQPPPDAGPDSAPPPGDAAPERDGGSGPAPSPSPPGDSGVRIADLDPNAEADSCSVAHVGAPGSALVWVGLGLGLALASRRRR